MGISIIFVLSTHVISQQIALKAFLHHLFLLVFVFLFCGCVKVSEVRVRLAAIDSLLQVNPSAAWDSLQKMDGTPSREGDKAYYGLLQTIAQHKNHIPFPGDSVIAHSREWFNANGRDKHNQARSLFYNGLVLYRISANDTTAYSYMRDALQLIENGDVEDDRLEALACAYLGQINDHYTFNFPEAIRYYNKAIESEKRLDNPRNLASDLCDLLGCYLKTDQKEMAKCILIALDSTIHLHPEVRMEKTNNAKALYYLVTETNLDSAFFYARLWKAPTGQIGAKYGLLADYYSKTGQRDSAIFYKKMAYCNKRVKDTLIQYTYFHQLANLYSQQGNADSTAHYAQLAYQSLRDVLEQRTEKRILELEKRYDVTARETALEKARHQRNLLFIVISALILLLASFLRLLYARDRRQAAERMVKSVIAAAAKTHQNTLSQLRELRKKPKSRTVESLQEDIGTITRDIQRGFSQNFSDALEQNLDTLPARTRKNAEKLSGERAKIVFILSEMGYSDVEIAEFTCTSVDSVRTLGNNNQRTLADERGD